MRVCAHVDMYVLPAALGDSRPAVPMAPALHLSLFLLDAVAHGELTATMVQKIAHHAAKDGWGLQDPLSCALARAGGFGRQSGNILRDVLVASRRAGLMSTSVQPYVLSLPGGKGDIQMFLPPRDMLAGGSRLWAPNMAA